MLFLSVLTALGMHAALTHWPVPQFLLWMGWPTPPEWATFGLSLLLTMPLLLLLVQGFLGPLTRLLRALEGAVLSYREGDFSMSIAAPTRGTSLELGELLRLHGDLGQALREQPDGLAAPRTFPAVPPMWCTWYGYWDKVTDADILDNLALAGRHDEARDMFEHLLTFRNDVGLLAEEYDPRTQRLVGNFPQAFSHLSLVATACNLAHAKKPAEQRSEAELSARVSGRK